jgi:NAD(P)H-dependent FMN reductase
VAEWRRSLAESDALFVASPEYGMSLPGSLKNAIDWVIGSGELYRKPVAVTASVNTERRGLLGLAALTHALRAVDVRVVGGEPIVRGDGLDRAVVALLAALIEEARKAAEG